MNKLPLDLKKKIYDFCREPALLCVSSEFCDIYWERREYERKINDLYGGKLILYSLKEHKQEFETTANLAGEIYRADRRTPDPKDEVIKEIITKNTLYNIIQYYEICHYRFMGYFISGLCAFGSDSLILCMIEYFLSKDEEEALFLIVDNVRDRKEIVSYLYSDQIFVTFFEKFKQNKYREAWYKLFYAGETWKDRDTWYKRFYAEETWKDVLDKLLI